MRLAVELGRSALNAEPTGGLCLDDSRLDHHGRARLHNFDSDCPIPAWSS